MGIGNYLMTRMALRKGVQDTDLELERQRAAREAALTAGNLGLVTSLGKSITSGILDAGELADAAYKEDLAKTDATAAQAAANRALEEEALTVPDVEERPRVNEAATAAEFPVQESLPWRDLVQPKAPADANPDAQADDMSINQLTVVKNPKTPKPSTAVDAMPSAKEKKEQLDLSLAMLDESLDPRDKKSAAILRETLAKRGVDDAWLMAYMGGAPLPELPGKQSYTQRDFGNDNPKKIITHRYQMPTEQKLPQLQLSEEVVQPPVQESLPWDKLPQPEAPKVNVTKPAVSKALEEKAPLITKFTPPKFRKDPRVLATQIVEEAYARRPVGNPLTEFFNKNHTAAAKQAAIESTLGSILATRKTAIKDSFERWHSEQKLVLDEESLDSKIKLAAAQAELADAKAKKTTLDVSVKKPISSKDRDKLDSYRQAHIVGRRLTRAGKRLTFKMDDNDQYILDANGKKMPGDGIPLGVMREIAKAEIESIGSIASVPTSTTTIGGGGGAGGDAGIPGVAKVGANLEARGQTQTTGGGPVLDAEKFKEALARVDMTNLTKDQKDFVNQYLQTVQTIGKVKEGGKMTDKDLVGHAKALINQADPGLAMRQVNELLEDNALGYKLNRASIAASVTSGVEDIYAKELEQEDLYFTKEEMDAAHEADFSATEAWRQQNQPRQPGDTNRAKASALLDDINKKIDEATKAGNASEVDRLRKMAADALARQRAGGKKPKPAADAY
jgi:hypothetical protein